MGLVFTIRSQCKWWYPMGTLLSSVYISGWRRKHHPVPRKGYPAGQARYSRCIPHCPCVPIRLQSARNPLEQENIYQQSFAFWSKISTAVTDLIAWVLACTGICYQLHYLNDFLFLVAPDSTLGSQVLSMALQTLRQLGIPVAVHKTEGPTTVLIFLLTQLGFELSPTSFCNHRWWLPHGLENAPASRTLILAGTPLPCCYCHSPR